MKLVSQLLVAGLLVSGCVGKEVESRINTKVSKEPEVSGTLELQNDAGFLIENSSLSREQKSRLRQLKANTDQQLALNREESLKLRSILLKDMFSTKYDRSEVKAIQGKIETLDHKRLALIFESMDKANGIFGRDTDADTNQRIMDRMMFGHEYQ